MEPIRAVIFDLDGLMINTEELAFAAWQRTLAPLGHTLNDDDFLAMVGLDEHDTVAYVLRATGMNDGRIPLARDFRKHMFAMLDTDLKPNPGLVELVSALAARNLPLGIASNSPSEHIRRALNRIGLAERFSAVVGRDQVLHGKPDADPYRTAAGLLDVEPVFCLAIEDSPVGMQSALAAGMRCALVSPQAFTNPAYAPATWRFESLPLLHAALDSFKL